jgi:hypothetical protein
MEEEINYRKTHMKTDKEYTPDKYRFLLEWCIDGTATQKTYYNATQPKESNKNPSSCIPLALIPRHPPSQSWGDGCGPYFKHRIVVRS